MVKTRPSARPPQRVAARLHVESSAGPAPARPRSLDRFHPSVRGVNDIEALLAAAALLRKSDGPEGVEPLVGPAQATRARAALQRAPADVRTALFALFAALDGPAAGVARALLLRAVAARSHALLEGDAHAALAVLGRLCVAMRGISAGELRARATVLDLDSRTNTHRADPQLLWDTRGTVHDGRRADGQGDNDGLFQRFTGACGPTTVQMMLAENDPVLAFAIHDAGLTSFSSTDRTAAFQRALLEQYGGGSALGRIEAWLRARVNNGIGRLVSAGSLDERAGARLRAHLFAGAPLDDRARDALAALRARYRFPSDAEVARLRARPWPKADQGITTDSLVTIVNQRCGAALGVDYRAHDVAPGQLWRRLDEVVRALHAGLDVPFGCSDPGHWMLLSSVKGRKPRRQLLVSDPDGGRTVWVEERRFVRGAFLSEDLHLARPGQHPWIDTVLLPQAQGPRR